MSRRADLPSRSTVQRALDELLDETSAEGVRPRSSRWPDDSGWPTPPSGDTFPTSPTRSEKTPGRHRPHLRHPRPLCAWPNLTAGTPRRSAITGTSETTSTSPLPTFSGSPWTTANYAKRSNPNKRSQPSAPGLNDDCVPGEPRRATERAALLKRSVTKLKAMSQGNRLDRPCQLV